MAYWSDMYVMSYMLIRTTPSAPYLVDDCESIIYSTESVRSPSRRRLRSALGLALHCYPKTLLKILWVLA
jgi:hypothetical protein